jgi:hypothetical protein
MYCQVTATFTNNEVFNVHNEHVRPLECSLPYQTLLVKGSVSFKEGEEAKASPYGGNRLNEKIKDLEKEAICYFTDGSQMWNQEFVGF